MLKGAWKDPWGAQHPAHVNNFALKVRRLTEKRNQHARNGVIMGMRRGTMAGDPSWLSQFIKHNSGIVKGAITAVSTAAGSLIGQPLLGAAAGKLFSSRVNMSSGGSTKIATNPVAPIPNMSFRSTASSGMGKAAGMTSALAPLPPAYAYEGQNMFNTPQIFDPAGMGAGDMGTPPDDGSGGDGSPVMAIPSSGGGTALWHHFFGKSNSKAIPVAQTNGMRPSGYHLNKHAYYLSSISTWLPAGSVWVKGRRRNPLNPRALHRSMARLISAKHAVKALGLLQVPKRHVRRRFGRPAAMKRLKAG